MKRILLVLIVSLGLQTQAQQSNPAYFCCDSITYWTDQGAGLFIGLDTTNMIHNPDSMTIYWGVCTGFSGGGICYTGDGMSDYFPQITTSDTIKVAYDVYIYENGSVEVCSIEDWLVYDQGTYNWVLLNMLPVSIREYECLMGCSCCMGVNDGKIYDMLGKKVITPIKGVMYIRDNQKFIIVQ